jgi:hypothetical protein
MADFQIAEPHRLQIGDEIELLFEPEADGPIYAVAGDVSTGFDGHAGYAWPCRWCLGRASTHLRGGPGRAFGVPSTHRRRNRC